MIALWLYSMGKLAVFLSLYLQQSWLKEVSSSLQHQQHHEMTANLFAVNSADQRDGREVHPHVCRFPTHHVLFSACWFSVSVCIFTALVNIDVIWPEPACRRNLPCYFYIMLNFLFDVMLSVCVTASWPSLISSPENKTAHFFLSWNCKRGFTVYATMYANLYFLWHLISL